MRRWLLMLLLLPVLSVAASMSVIDLHNRTADEVIPLIRPLLHEGDALTGDGYQLIIRTDGATLQQVREVLSRIDTRPRNLLITVRNAGQRSGSDRGISGSGSVQLGNHSGAQVQIHGTDRQRDEDSNILQKVRVLEGQQAQISAGQSIPYRTRQIYLHGRWVTVQDSVEFEDVGNSLMVRPRLSGDLVTLDIEPVYSSLSNRRGDIEYQRVQTQVSGRLGQWIPLSGIEESTSSTTNGLFTHHETQREQQGNIEVRVELLP